MCAAIAIYELDLNRRNNKLARGVIEGAARIAHGSERAIKRFRLSCNLIVCPFCLLLFLLFLQGSVVYGFDPVFRQLSKLPVRIPLQISSEIFYIGAVLDGVPKGEFTCTAVTGSCRGFSQGCCHLKVLDPVLRKSRELPVRIFLQIRPEVVRACAV